MPTDGVTKEIVKASAATALASLDWLTSGMVTDFRRHIAMALENGDTRFAAAARRDEVEMLETVCLTLSAVTRVTTGRALNGSEAYEAFVTAASDPVSRRRMRALWNECETSTDERIAMLAVGYFAGAAATSLQERQDCALRQLFPEDADTLGAVIEVEDVARKDSAWVVAVEFPDTPAGICMLHRGNRFGLANTSSALIPGRPIGSESLRALASARCLEIAEGLAGFNKEAQGFDGGDRREQSVRMLPLGRHLHENLSKVDWREIAKRRRNE